MISDDIIKGLTGHERIGLPGLIALKKLKLFLKNGGVLTKEYKYMKEPEWQAKKRADCIQACAKDAWQKSHDDKRTLDERLYLLNAVLKYMKNADFGWQVLGISELDFYRQKFSLCCDHIDARGIVEPRSFSRAVEDEILDEVDSLEKSSLLSDDDISAIRQDCERFLNERLSEIKSTNEQEFHTVYARITKPNTSPEDRIRHIEVAREILHRNLSRDRTEERVRFQELRKMEEESHKEIFSTRYQNIIKSMIGVDAYDAMESLENDAIEQGMKIHDVLGMDNYQVYCKKKDGYLYDAAAAFIAESRQLMQENPQAAYFWFDVRYRNFTLNNWQTDYGWDVQQIHDHKHELFKASVRYSFDQAVKSDDVIRKAEALMRFQNCYHPDRLAELFDDDTARDMRAVAKSAFVTAAKTCIEAYLNAGDLADLFDAGEWRERADQKWSDLTNLTELEASMELRGHELPQPRYW